MTKIRQWEIRLCRSCIARLCLRFIASREMAATVRIHYWYVERSDVNSYNFCCLFFGFCH